MVEAAGEAYFFENPDTDLAAELKSCLAAANGFSGRRNEIAHGIVKELSLPGNVIFIPDKVMARPMVPNGFAVVPSEYATNKTELAQPLTILHQVARKPKYTYSSAEINALAILFRQLGDRVGNLARRILMHSISGRNRA
jgi:hypothetical protein